MAKLPKVDIDFVRMKDDPALVQVGVTATGYAKNPSLKEKWPADVTNPEDVLAIGSRFQEARNEASKGGSDRIEARNMIREELNTAFCTVVREVEILAIKNPEIITALGLVQRKTTRSKGGDPEEPVIRLSYGIHSGVILVSAHTLAGASAMEVEFAEGDPLVEENWKHGCTLPRFTQLPVENLPQTKRIYFRARGIWPSGNGPWSATMSIIVL